MLLLGIDPGLQKTGWGVIRRTTDGLWYVAHGVIKSSQSAPFASRLRQIYESLDAVVQQFSPDAAAVEETFVNSNPSSTLRLGMARGVILLAPAMREVPVFEYSATQVKKAVVGSGHADKDQVAMMVKRLLRSCADVSQDAADALAVSICHAHYGMSSLPTVRSFT